MAASLLSRVARRAARLTGPLLPATLPRQRRTAAVATTAGRRSATAAPSSRPAAPRRTAGRGSPVVSAHSLRNADGQHRQVVRMAVRLHLTLAVAAADEAKRPAEPAARVAWAASAPNQVTHRLEPAPLSLRPIHVAV